ncbi:hypothetical protein Ddye_010489 [Dipteronia dyeriana]|uniref:Uncharacterized protein n=1 Tax=Dipteronia dyeriana TaxID=168575 RepID=A0AAD9XDU9_9ROSI|nr:hypothetical protein Ddye_010489 [Dipteronia dyeriana]
MAEIRSMYKRLILVAVLVAWHAILSAEGRQIKSINKKETTNKQGSSSSSSINSMKEIFSPPTMTFGDLEAYKDAFRSTTPGNSPSVGHSFAQDQQNAESKLVVADNSQKAGHFITGDKNDFKPTAPGHSPGVGHAFLNKIAEPNA